MHSDISEWRAVKSWVQSTRVTAILSPHKHSTVCTLTYQVCGGGIHVTGSLVGTWPGTGRPISVSLENIIPKFAFPPCLCSLVQNLCHLSKFQEKKSFFLLWKRKYFRGVSKLISFLRKQNYLPGMSDFQRQFLYRILEYYSQQCSAGSCNQACDVGITADGIQIIWLRGGRTFILTSWRLTNVNKWKAKEGRKQNAKKQRKEDKKERKKDNVRSRKE